MNKLIILCIDDEVTILDSLKIELKKSLGDEYIIETCESGEDALELVNELLKDRREVAVAIADYIMPGIKGDELLKYLHTISPKTLKIMLTGQAELEAVSNAIKYAKLYRYISKPWQSEDLKLTIIEAVYSYLQDKEITQKNIELQQINEAFSRFVPRQFLQLLNKSSIVDIKLGDSVQQEMSVLFADIRDFTNMSEKMTPEENFKFINSYLSFMEPVITENHGFIDKYIGDEIMALFSGEADNALKAGISMLYRLQKYNQNQVDDGGAAIKIGIGINTGSLMLGTVGGQNRMEGTVISDAVNLASRVGGLTKNYGVSLLITEQTYLRLSNPDAYAIRTIDTVKVKGKSQLVTVYEVFEADLPSIKAAKFTTLKSFTQALILYNQGEIAAAKQLFAECFRQNPSDRVAQIYFERCAAASGDKL